MYCTVEDCRFVWCGVVWCGVAWCGVVWCAVVWSRTLRFKDYCHRDIKIYSRRHRNSA